MLSARKHNLSCKRKVIEGKYLITGAELVGIQEAENAIKIRKKKREKDTAKESGGQKKSCLISLKKNWSTLIGSEVTDTIDCIGNLYYSRSKEKFI